MKAGREWLIRDLVTEAERQLREERGVALATALVLCPSRDSAIPFYDALSDYVEDQVCGE